jgi:hypothetical protein
MLNSVAGKDQEEVHKDARVLDHLREKVLGATGIATAIEAAIQEK